MAVGSDAVAEVARWADGIEEMHQCIAGRFRRPEPRRRALAYLRGLFTRLVWTESRPPDFILYWSCWRRRHLARA